MSDSHWQLRPHRPLDAQALKEGYQIVGDLVPFKSWIIWTDLILSALIGWGSLTAAAFQPNFSLSQAALTLLASILLFRGQMLMHEISHFRRELSKFEVAFNLLFGFPNKFPSYTGFPHTAHHGTRSFGTNQDAEYERLSELKSPLILLLPFVQSAVLPVVLAVRFTLVPVVYLFVPKLRRLAYEKASTISMNPAYARPIDEAEDLPIMYRQDAGSVIYSLAFAALIVGGILPVAFLGVWYVALAFALVLNAYRSAVNHRYVSAFKQSSFEQQVLDSVTIEGGILTEAWAPIGLRYHSLHHMFPRLPYYALGIAHRRLMARLSADHPYRATVEKNWPTAMRELIARINDGRRRREAEKARESA